MSRKKARAIDDATVTDVEDETLPVVGEIIATDRTPSPSNAMTENELLGHGPDPDAVQAGTSGRSTCAKCGKHRPFAETLCTNCYPNGLRVAPMSEIDAATTLRRPATAPHLYGRAPR